MTVLETIRELYKMLMPDDTSQSMSPGEWREVAAQNFNIIAGMVISSHATAEQLAEIKKLLEAKNGTIDDKA